MLLFRSVPSLKLLAAQDDRWLLAFFLSGLKVERSRAFP